MFTNSLFFSLYLQEYTGEIIKNRLQQLKAKRPCHLCHPHQPVGGVSIHQLAQVLQEGEQQPSKQCSVVLPTSQWLKQGFDRALHEEQSSSHESVMWVKDFKTTESLFKKITSFQR